MPISPFEYSLTLIAREVVQGKATRIEGANPIQRSIAYERHLYCNVVLCIADLLKACGYEEDERRRVSGAEIVLVAVLATQYFQNHHERALGVLVRLGNIAPISVSRFNRRLHEIREWVPYLGEVLGAVFGQGESSAFMPEPIMALT